MKKKQKQNLMVVGIIGALAATAFSSLWFINGHGDEVKSDLHADVLAHSDRTDIEKEYRNILKDDKNIVLALDLDGTIKFASDEVEEKLGIRAKELVGQSYFMQFHDGDLATFMLSFGKLMKDHTSVSAIGPYRLRKGNGEFELHIGYATPIIENGEIKEILVVTKSIQDKIIESEEFKKSNRESSKNSAEKDEIDMETVEAKDSVVDSARGSVEVENDEPNHQ